MFSFTLLLQSFAVLFAEPCVKIWIDFDFPY